MSANSKIEWTDHTFNGWIGCQAIGPGCYHCYAEARAKRFGQDFAARRRTSAKYWAEPLKWNKADFRQCAGCGWRGAVDTLDRDTCPECDSVDLAAARQRVFASSLADVFDNAVDPAWRADLFALIAKTPNLDWLLLTKRIGNAARMLDEALAALSHGLTRWSDAPWPNVWLGATVVNPEELARDLSKLLDLRAAVRFLSVEPMLAPIDFLGALTRWQDDPRTNQRWHAGDLAVRAGEILIHWVIAGGESGPQARPVHPDWIRALRDQCRAGGVAFFFKQWGEWAPKDAAFAGKSIYPSGSVAMGLPPDNILTIRCGKTRAGRLLDGRIWGEFPQRNVGEVLVA